MKVLKSAVLYCAAMIMLTACTPISQKPLAGVEYPGISSGVNGEEAFTEYAASIPEITPAEASITIQAEDCSLNGSLKVSDKRKGFKGNGYVTGFKGGSADYLIMSADIPVSQHYDITIRAAADISVKNSIMINGDDLGEFTIKSKKEKFTETTFYGIYLEQGETLIQINKGSDEFDFDCIEIVNNMEIYEEEQKIEAKPVSEKSSYEAKDVLRYFKENLGENIITGQYVADSKNLEVERIHDITGQYPVIRFGDIGGYGDGNPPLDSEINAAREWDERGGIVGFIWCWNSPAEDSSVYSVDTEFDLSEAVTDEKIAILGISEIQDLRRQGVISREALALVEDIDEVAQGLNELADMGIPVLWRPLHRAGDVTYWWNKAGGEAYIWLYELMFERMTVYHELDNLIWIWDGADDEYMVDSDKYDIISANIYLAPNSSFGSRSDKFQRLRMLTENEKIIALSECSGIPGIDDMLRDRAVWSFFGLWHGEYLLGNEIRSDKVYTSEDELMRIYNAENSITLDEYAGVYGVQ